MDQVPVEELESVRQRLSQLTHWLNRLQAIAQQPVLPPYHVLQSQFSMVMNQLSALSTTLALHSEVLRTTSAYPLPKFPVAVESGLLAALLRKRPEPDVDEWIAQGAKRAKIATIADDDLWGWAQEYADSQRESRVWTPEQDVNEDNNKKEPNVELDRILQYMYQGISIDEPVSSKSIPGRRK
ncbi:mediator of RNA polymerase II transcription complex subunit 8-domain-containing protein [Lipomyces arxii]|uniref:mediator of RNA polymerase II transcription complex subunit 8-domain-containing protein n=1 Tax=Lipomyces arxii TaxID=56418 RepID=UPI0034CE601F